MNLSQESWAVRNSLGEFLQELMYVDRRWIRLDSCANNAFVPQRGADQVDCPLHSFCDLLGISAKRANDYLRAANLMEPHKVHKTTLSPNRKHWDSLKSEFSLDIELEQASHNQYLGRKVWVVRIGCLSNHNNNTTFNAKQQAQRFFDGESDFDRLQGNDSRVRVCMLSLQHYSSASERKH
jgi:hypothetical protein